ncbi:MAG: hypothetical protein EXR83_01490 [Gammaproteobacteria bacterium]|nr:hypothetical protein [Gammaproteobacteria bacterium]
MALKDWLFGSRPRTPEIVDANGVRSLHLGGGAIQSALRLAAPDRLELEYTRAMMAALLFNATPRRVLMIGLGGGSMARFVLAHLPDTHFTAVEVNASVVAAARALFGLPHEDARLAVRVCDGLAHLEAHPHTADLLLLDAFDNRTAPAHLRGERAYAAAYAALRNHGILVQNFMAEDPNLELSLSLMSATFAGRVLLLPTTDRHNVIGFALRTPARHWPIEHLKTRAGDLAARYPLDFPTLLNDLLSHNRCANGGLLLGPIDAPDTLGDRTA